MYRVCFFVFFSFVVLYARALDTLVTQNLKHVWVSIDPAGDLHPYTTGSTAELIFFEVPVSGEDGDLLLQSGKPVDIWMNNELILFQLDSTVVLDMDSIALTMPGESRLRFKIFSAGGIDESLVTQRIRVGDFKETDLLEVIARDRAGKKDDLYLITISLILMLTGIFRRFFPVIFQQSIQNPLSLRVRSISADRTYEGFGSIDNLYSIFFLGAISALFFRYLGYSLVVISEDDIMSGLLNWLAVSLIISATIVLKYWWTKLISYLYQFREISNIQVQDFIRFFTLVMLLGTGLTLMDFSLFNAVSGWFGNLSVYLVLFTLLFFQIWFFRKFDKFYTHKKLMIISYLCTTEFLPGFLAIYWLVKL